MAKKRTSKRTTKTASKRAQHPWLQPRQLPLLDAAPAAPAATPRLLTKAEVCSIVGASFPSIWQWMRAGFRRWR